MDQRMANTAYFPLQPYRSKTCRISLLREHSGKTDDMDTR